MSVKRIKAGARNTKGEPHACAPKTGEIICVQTRRADRSRVHEHFPADQWKQATEFHKKAQVEDRRPSRPSEETYREYAERWFEGYSCANRSTVWSAIARPFPLFGSDRLETIDVTRVKGVQRGLMEPTAKQLAKGAQVYAHSTTGVTMTYTKMILRQAYADGLIPRDPTFNVRMPTKDTLDSRGVVTAEEVPTHAEVRQLIALAQPRWRLAVLLGFGCGWRAGEAIGLAPTEVDLATGQITMLFQEQIRGRVGPKTWRGKRTITPPDAVMFEIRRLMRDVTDPTKPFATGPLGGRPNRKKFYRHWAWLLDAAGLPPERYKFHSARHYCVSTMLAKGVVDTEVADYVGDSVTTIKKVYAHWVRDQAPQAKGALDAAFAQADDDVLPGIAVGDDAQVIELRRRPREER